MAQFASFIALGRAKSDDIYTHAQPTFPSLVESVDASVPGLRVGLRVGFWPGLRVRLRSDHGRTMVGLRSDSTRRTADGHAPNQPTYTPHAQASRARHMQRSQRIGGRPGPCCPCLPCVHRAHCVPAAQPCDHRAHRRTGRPVPDDWRGARRRRLAVWTRMQHRTSVRRATRVAHARPPTCPRAWESESGHPERRSASRWQRGCTGLGIQRERGETMPGTMASLLCIAGTGSIDRCPRHADWWGRVPGPPRAGSASH